MYNAVAENVLGTIGTIFWCIQLIPQIIRNYKVKNCDGLPPLMMFLWAASGIPFSVYFFGIDGSIPLRIQPQLFTFFCIVTWAQTLYYPPHAISRKRMVLFLTSFVLVSVGLEVGFILWLRPLHRRGIEWPMLIIGIIASILLAVGLIPPYFELAKRKGRVIGINFVFLTVDSLGAIFSLLSVVVGHMDIMTLKFQRDGEYESAYNIHHQLFLLDIIANYYYEEVEYIRGIQNGAANTVVDDLSSLSPSVKSLRYLIFRNRGMLYLNILKSGKKLDSIVEPGSSWEKKARDIFYSMIDDFCVALLYNEADEKLVNVLYHLFTYIGSLKLSRFTLEYATSSAIESDDLAGLLPVDSAIESRLNVLKSMLNYTQPKSNRNNIRMSSPPNLQFLDQFKQDFETQELRQKQKNKLFLKLKGKSDTLSWENVICSLNDTIVELQDHSKVEDIHKPKLRYVDPYQLSEEPIENVIIEYELAVTPTQVESTLTTEVKEKEDANSNTDKIQNEQILAKDEERQSPEETTTTTTTTTSNDMLENKQQIHRASKRLARVESSEFSKPEVVVQKSHFAGLDYFVKNLRNLIGDFKVCDIPGVYFEEVETEQYVKDFLSIVTSWKSSYSDAYSSFCSIDAKSTNNNSKLVELLNSFSNKLQSEAQVSHIASLNELENGETIVTHLSGNLDYVELKTKIIKHLLADDKAALYLNSKWGDSLIIKMSEWVFQFEGYLFNSISKSYSNLTLAVGVLEILVDNLINLQVQVKNSIDSKRVNKTIVNGLCQDLIKLEDKISKWLQFLQEAFVCNKVESYERWILFARFKWCQILKQKAQTVAWNEDCIIKSSLEEVLAYAESSDLPLNIHYPNCKNFPSLTISNLKTQLTIVSVLTIFSEILFASNMEDNTRAMHLLEDILMCSSSREKNEAILSIKEFLKTNSVDLSLSLWNVLLQFYKSAKLYGNLVSGFVESLDVFNKMLKSLAYATMDERSRFDSLCKVLGFYNSSLSLVIEHLAETDWQLKGTIPFQSLVPLFEICLLFEIHEEACSISSLKTSVKKFSPASYNLLKDMFLKTVVLILANIQSSLGDAKTLHDSIKLFHAQLGASGICSSANGIFLRAAQEYLNKLDSAEKDIAQVIKCRYHYNIGFEDFLPFEHESQKKEELRIADCEELAKFVLPLCFKTNTIKNVPKQDMKVLIEEIYEVVGNPDFDNDAHLSRNKASIDHFLDTTCLTPRFIRNSFHGLVKLDIDETQNKIASSGLYYLQGLLIFSSYKSRKKNMQGRAVEIETAISLFTYDLLYGSNRLESWFLIAQAYGYLVEDDLIWTSDKLTVFDRKVGTANLQRKSLVCYLMAINCTLDPSIKEQAKHIVGYLMSYFAKELFSCVSAPMDMLALKVQSQPRFVNGPSGASFASATEKSVVSKNFCFKLIKQAFHLSLKSGGREWTDYYYLSKVQRKCGDPPSLVLNTMSRACKKAATLKLSESIVEPHYCLVSLCMKYVKSKEITPSEAVAYLRSNPLLKFNEKALEGDFYDIVISSLKQVDAADKKNWQHKAKYRLSRVLYEQFDDVQGAIDIMSDFICLKSVNKQLVSIWKPEFERPGKHFLYTYQYIRFYIELLKRKKDINSLLVMMPKLRRSSSIMINLYNAWELLCSSSCRIIRTSFDLGDSFEFTDNFINNLPFSIFLANTKHISDAIQEKGIPKELEPHLCFLFASNDMRKSNNGYGPTSLIDDTFVSIYFKIYEHFFKDVNSHTYQNSPNSKRKIAKKDIFPIATDLLKITRRDVEEKAKEIPDIYNYMMKELESKSSSKKKDEEIADTKLIKDVNDEDGEIAKPSTTSETTTDVARPSTPKLGDADGESMPRPITPKSNNVIIKDEIVEKTLSPSVIMQANDENSTSTITRTPSVVEDDSEASPSKSLVSGTGTSAFEVESKTSGLENMDEQTILPVGEDNGDGGEGDSFEIKSKVNAESNSDKVDERMVTRRDAIGDDESVLEKDQSRKRPAESQEQPLTGDSTNTAIIEDGDLNQESISDQPAMKKLKDGN
ncbi:HIR3 [Candida oxycetoniae]|uniref:HIR3 n=1 Tax=Candida oxycetoniae TaxID=497107 RepID=A0AAI9SUD5_9ASCO|nr:HIR3 [Candida oxycetoniae]KAI3402854.2 HIR3 [Candida oxycetoniae]